MTLYSLHFYEMYVNLGKKMITFLGTSVGSGDEQMDNQLEPWKVTTYCAEESYFWDTVKILDVILNPRWSSE